MIIEADRQHIYPIKQLMDQHKRELGFITTGAISDSINRQEILISEVDDQITGLVRFHTRKDGWTTIREIVVRPECRHKQLGSYLVSCLPLPIRLKCPIDLPSNQFYKAIGLLNVWTEQPDKGRALNVWQSQPDLIFCAGNNRKYGQITREAGMLYGTRHDCLPFWKPYMVDINWKKYDWNDYLKKIAKWQPKAAMVPDYEYPEQQGSMVRRACQLVELGVERVMVCPKFDGAVDDIPDWCLVAVSVPSRYAGYLPAVEELNGRKVHLLGGSPQKQMKLFKEYQAAGITVASVDGNAFITASGFGTYFKDGKWKNEGYHAVSIEEAFRRSAFNVVSYWKSCLKLNYGEI